MRLKSPLPLMIVMSLKLFSVPRLVGAWTASSRSLLCRSSVYPTRVLGHGIPKQTTSTLLRRLATTEKIEDPLDENYFLRQVEETIQKVLVDTTSGTNLNIDDKDDILKLPPHQRGAFGVARHLNVRLQALRRNGDCPRCWMQRAHCICDRCQPVALTEQDGSTTATTAIIRRIFLVMHHKEIALKVDTAKLILASFPYQARLVVGGIPEEFQESMRELQEAMDHHPENCLVLFPDDSAQLYKDIQTETKATIGTEVPPEGWDLIVLDGTWAQARKLHLANFAPRDEGGPRRIQLSEEDVAQLAGATDNEMDSRASSIGHQLRRHCTTWRQVGTFEATRLCLRELLLSSSTQDERTDSVPIWKQLEDYQQIANAAALGELGPPRISSKS